MEVAINVLRSNNGEVEGTTDVPNTVNEQLMHVVDYKVTGRWVCFLI